MIKPVLFLLLQMSAIASAAPTLLVLEKNGDVSEWEKGARSKIATVQNAIDLATCPSGATWVLTDREVYALELTGGHARTRQPRYRVANGKSLTCGAQLYVATADGHVSLLANGKLKVAAKFDHVRYLFSSDTESFAALEHTIFAIVGDEKFDTTDMPIATAATKSAVFVIDREGNFNKIDRATHASSNLNYGAWFGALGLVAIDDSLYIATQIGKLWRVSTAAYEKELIEDDGWRSTIALTRSRLPAPYIGNSGSKAAHSP